MRIAKAIAVGLAALSSWCFAPTSQARQGDEIVATESVEIRFSHQDGLPVRWRLIDPLVAGEEQSRSVDLIDRTRIAENTEFSAPLALKTTVRTEPSVERVEKSDGVQLDFSWPQSTRGLEVSRRYFIPRQGFTSELVFSFRNTSEHDLDLGTEEPLEISVGPGLGPWVASSGGLGGGLYSYTRPILNSSSGIEQLDPTQAQTIASEQGFRWAGLHNRYFAAVLIADHPLTGAEIRPSDHPNSPNIWLRPKPIVLAPGEERQLRFELFLGPKDRTVLEAAGHDLDEILFPSLWQWLRALCFVLMSLLDILYSSTSSWGLSIIALAVVIRLLTFPIAHAGLKQQAKTKAEQVELRPLIADINERFKGDPSGKSQALNQLYKERGISPFGAFKGCAWALIQIPIFVALFNLLGQSFGLRDASFLWIDDLSLPDMLFPLGVDLPILGSSFNILPFFMAATQIFVTQLSAAPAVTAKEKSRQRKTTFLLAAVFLVLFYSFPAGLVLYWMMANLGQLGQQIALESSQKRAIGASS